MSRTPRRGRVPPVPRHNDSLNRFKQPIKTKGSNALKDVLNSPLNTPRSKEKSLVNRCCYISPAQRDFGNYFNGSSPCASMATRQVTEQKTDHKEFITMLKDQYGPAIPNITQREAMKKVPCDTRNKVKTSSQRSSTRSGNTAKFKTASDGSFWQPVGSAEEVDKLISSSDSCNLESPSKHIFISKVPRVKVIAEKFSKYKRGNLELRRLDEKVVCVEYDVFNHPDNETDLNPVQRLRAFFSTKPRDNDSGKRQGIPTLPSNIKNEFGVLEDDLQKLTEKELEFIDGKIEENKSYLEDLRRILKRQHVIKAQRNRNSLDLQSLYELARKDKRPLNCDFSETNLLSKAELQEIKDLILQQCTSSIHGFSRRTIKKKENGSRMDPSVISEIIMAELLR